MSKAATRPAMPVPAELMPLISKVEAAFHPVDLWLFGSRARGDHRLDSDWDVLVVLPDDAPEALTDPVATWSVARESAVRATVLSTRQSELESIWGLPNTLGYDLAREGIRLIGG